MIAKPIAGQNAIEAIAFVLIFSREFSSSEIEHFLSLEHIHKDTLPSEWTLRASSNIIVANCWNYSRWEEVWPFARSLLKSVAQEVALGSNGVIAVTMQTVDRFVYESIPDNYNISDVFNPHSPFLTPQVAGAGPLWHVNQGWFADRPEVSAHKSAHSSRLLNVLNLSSAEVDGKLIATIDHTGQVGFESGMGVSELFLDHADMPTPKSPLDVIFSELHEVNTRLVRQILSEKKLEQIGLKK